MEFGGLVHPGGYTQITGWWKEAEAAVRTQQFVRARRYLRWILAIDPENEDAWLWLARLASTQEARLAYLRQAYAFHPGSRRVQDSLRQARSLQLEQFMSTADSKSGGICPLPTRSKRQTARLKGVLAKTPFRKTANRISQLPLWQIMARSARSWSTQLATFLSLPNRLGSGIPGLQPDGVAGPRSFEAQDSSSLSQVQGLVQVGERFAIVQTLGQPAENPTHPDPQSILQAIAFELWLVQHRAGAKIEIYIRP